jgi:hypothetical protein
MNLHMDGSSVTPLAYQIGRGNAGRESVIHSRVFRPKSGKPLPNLNNAPNVQPFEPNLVGDYKPSAYEKLAMAAKAAPTTRIGDARSVIAAIKAGSRM